MKLKCYLDSNILLYYIFESSEYFAATRDLMLSFLTDEATLYISPLTIDEFTYQLDILSRINNKKRSDFYQLVEIFLSTIMSLPNLKIVNLPTQESILFKFVDLMKNFNLKPRDAFHLLTMLENDIEYIATYDKDFNKVVKSGIIRKYN